jgi:hypothetical protein
MIALTDDEEGIVELLPDDDKLRDCVIGLLEVHSEVPLLTDSPGLIVLRALDELEHRSRAIDILDEIALDETKLHLREAAIACLGYLTGEDFIADLGHHLEKWRQVGHWCHGLRNAIAKLEEQYCGDDLCDVMCPAPEDPEHDRWRYNYLFNLVMPLERLPCPANQWKRIKSLLAAVRELIPADLREGVAGREPDAVGQTYFDFFK